MFEVFKSRCSVQFSCMYATPLMSWLAKHFTSLALNGFAAFKSIKPLKSCSQNSITMNTESREFPTTISDTSTMLGWAMLSKMRASRSAVIGKPSFSFSILTFFNAAILPLSLSLARKTTPYVPSSILFICSNANTLRHVAVESKKRSFFFSSREGEDETCLPRVSRSRIAAISSPPASEVDGGRSFFGNSSSSSSGTCSRSGDGDVDGRLKVSGENAWAGGPRDGPSMAPKSESASSVFFCPSPDTTVSSSPASRASRSPNASPNASGSFVFPSRPKSTLAFPVCFSISSALSAFATFGVSESSRGVTSPSLEGVRMAMICATFTPVTA
mmetsp:Transcript_9971/g.37022  ORF Transcript_9971/g.37022 Transcript_9971/m.37022 type:complete len:330 (+) Transcript_9971:656-1645(+)